MFEGRQQQITLVRGVFGVLPTDRQGDLFEHQASKLLLKARARMVSPQRATVILEHAVAAAAEHGAYIAVSVKAFSVGLAMAQIDQSTLLTDRRRGRGGLRRIHGRP